MALEESTELLLLLIPISEESLPGFFLALGAWSQLECGMWVGQPERGWELGAWGAPGASPNCPLSAPLIPPS